MTIHNESVKASLLAADKEAKLHVSADSPIKAENIEILDDDNEDDDLEKLSREMARLEDDSSESSADEEKFSSDSKRSDSLFGLEAESAKRVVAKITLNFVDPFEKELKLHGFVSVIGFNDAPHLEVYLSRTDAIALYQTHVLYYRPDGGIKTVTAAVSRIKHALGQNKRKKKIRNIKERKTIDAVKWIGTRLKSYILRVPGNPAARFDSPWTNRYNSRNYPDWKVSSVTTYGDIITHLNGENYVRVLIGLGRA